MQSMLSTQDFNHGDALDVYVYETTPAKQVKGVPMFAEWHLAAHR